MIYADNAATSRLRSSALEAMLPYFRDGFGNPSSLHSVGQRANSALFDARERAAKCLGAMPNEIYFTSGGSEADNQAILTGARLGERKGKKHIISTAFEHHAVLHTLDRMKREGFEITLLPVGEKGLVSAGQVADAIRPDTALVTVMFANNEIGTIQPIGEIAAVCRERGVLFHTDAVQAVGHVGVDVGELGVDMLSLSAHKFGGPTGTGILYARRGVRPEILIEGGAQERGRRAGTENLAAIVGMAVALEEACAGIEKNAPRVRAMRDRLIEGLSEIPHGVLNGDSQRRLPGSVNFCFEGIEGESLLLLLDDEGICASSGSACTSGSLDPSHVLLAIGRPHEIAHGSLRLTINEDNTPEQIEKIIVSTKKVVERLRAMSPVWRDLVSGRKQFVIK